MKMLDANWPPKSKMATKKWINFTIFISILDKITWKFVLFLHSCMCFILLKSLINYLSNDILVVIVRQIFVSLCAFYHACVMLSFVQSAHLFHPCVCTISVIGHFWFHLACNYWTIKGILPCSDIFWNWNTITNYSYFIGLCCPISKERKIVIYATAGVKWRFPMSNGPALLMFHD